jgi:uncharacterized MAPEG superfamily protein
VLVCALTIVGGVRERAACPRRGRGRDGALAALDWAFLGGPSASPLADMDCHGVKRFSFLGAIGMAVVFTVYGGWLTSRHFVPDAGVFAAYQLSLTALLAQWLVADAQERRCDRSTFDHGAWALIFFGVYAPCYLVSTRRARGLLTFAGMILLYMLPKLAELVGSHVS